MDGERKAQHAASRPERLQKVLAHAGVASRRECEQIIREGRVAVDGNVVTELGTRVDPGRSRIEVDGLAVRAERKVYYLFNKPRGALATNAPSSEKKRIIDYFAGSRERLYPVGRLDADSEGLIVVTNDGEFANLLTHPRYRISKTYRVLVEGRLDEAAVSKLRSGIHLSEGRSGPARVRVTHRSSSESVAEVTISEGLNREVRRLFAALGYEVKRLRRTAIGGIQDPKLGRGKWRPLRPAEVQQLRSAALEAVREHPRRFPSKKRRVKR